MTEFNSFWTAYASESEARTNGKAHWSEKSLARKIVRRALQGLSAAMGQPTDRSSGTGLDDLDDGIVASPSTIAFRGIRFALVGVETPNKVSAVDFSGVLADRAREAVCLCVLPTVDLSIWPLTGAKKQVGAGTIVPLYPQDVDAIASRRTKIVDLVEYKLQRRLVFDKSDPGTQFDERLVKSFLDARKKAGDRAQKLQEVMNGVSDDVRSWLEHPLSARVHSALEAGRGCLLVGPSSSGKSVLAFQLGRSFLLGGRRVDYVNLGQLDGVLPDLFTCLFPTAPNGKQPLLVVDDLQSNPAVARYILALASAAPRASVHRAPTLLAVSWVDYSRDAAAWFDDCLCIAVRPHQISNKLARQYSDYLPARDIERIIATFGVDIFLLRLSFEQSRERQRLAGPADLAEYVWDVRTRGSVVENSDAARIALVVGSLGRFDIATPPSFLHQEASVNEEQVRSLLRSGLLRRHQANISMGHRSLCALLADWLESTGGWKEFDRLRGPRTVDGVVLDYLSAQSSSLTVDSLRALHARAGFKDRPRLNRRAAALVELWEAFCSVLERIEHQQMIDGTWGSVPSSAMFAVAAFSELGKPELADESVAFLRRHWAVMTDSGGSIRVATDGLATSKDFGQIKLAMAQEDATSVDGQVTWTPAQEVDIDRFHRTWVLGLVLCAEAACKKPRVRLEELAQLVEKQQLPSGAFYPQRVPWSTARVLLGLAACGRTVDTSRTVERVVSWLLRDTTDGGACHNGLWRSGTGRWNSTLETTGMVLAALAAVGYDCSDDSLYAARSHLLSQRNRWSAPGKELDGALAIQAFLDTGGAWEEVASEAQALSRWAKGEAFWQGAVRSAEDSLEQSCRVAQIASHLIGIGWSAIRSDLPGFLDALVTPYTFRDELAAKTALPVTTPSRRPSAEPSATLDVELEVFKELAVISLDQCTVVGNYRRYDERTRNRLRDWKVRLQSPLLTPTQGHENFLIWAAPGSGKTFFVEEVARALEDDVAYIELNLARLSRDDFCRGLSRVRSCDQVALCLLDEIDAYADETWPYEECFSLLDLNLGADRSMVFVLVGSSSTGLNGMVKDMLQRSKGKDLVDRVPVGNRFEIPGLSLKDLVVVITSQILSAAEARQQSIREVEALALYYALKNQELRTPRQLRDLAVAAIQRVASGDDRLKYDDLFHRGDNKNQQFWVDHQDAVAKLADTFVRVES